MTDTTHTPTPWEWRASDAGKVYVEAPCKGTPPKWLVATVAGRGNIDTANAELIVRAVNERDALLRVAEAAKVYEAKPGATCRGAPGLKTACGACTRCDLRAALAALEGTE